VADTTNASDAQGPATNDEGTNLRQVDVGASDILFRGTKGALVRLDEDTMLSTYAPDYPLAAVDFERNNAREELVAGVPVIIPFETVRVGEGYGVVFEAHNSKSVAEILRDSPDEQTARTYGAKLGAVLREVHAIDGAGTTLASKKAQDVKRIQEVVASGLFTADEMQSALDLYDELPDATTVLHGDLTPIYTVERDGDLLFIDMMDAGVGHPILDLAASYTAYVMFGAVSQDLAMRLFGVSAPLLAAMWQAMFKTYVGEVDAKDFELKLNIVRAYANVRPILLMGLLKNMPQEYMGIIKQMWPKLDAGNKQALAYLKTHPDFWE